MLKYLCFITLACSLSSLLAQEPEQDCIDAIQLCKGSYSVPVSYVGSGLFPNEINPSVSCLGGGELNGSWYVIYVTESGNLNFSVIPIDTTDDYDWAVFNLTNATCDDIYFTESLEVSCNFSGHTGNNGITGPNGMLTGEGAAQNEEIIPVLAGEKYLIDVSNFSSTSSGYVIDLSLSTAQFGNGIFSIVDSIAPINPGDTSITIYFGDNIPCAHVDSSVFTVSGPDGNHTVISTFGQNCQSSVSLDNTFVLEVSPPLSQPGYYSIIVDSAYGSYCQDNSQLGNAVFYVGIDEIENQLSSSDFEVYPNPANDILYIKADLGKDKLVQADVYTLTGELLKSFTNTENLTPMDISDLSDGFYFLKVQIGKSTVSKKFVVIH